MKRKIFSILFALVLVLSFSLVTAVPAVAANEVWVDDDWSALTSGEAADGHTFGTDAFATIQGGIDAIAEGGTVNVAAGTYKEHIVIDKSNLNLIGEDRETTIIDVTRDPSLTSEPPGILIDGKSPGVHDVTVSGFTIGGAVQEGGTASLPGPQAVTAILIYNADNNVIENNILVNNLWHVFVCAEWSTAGSAYEGSSCKNNRIANNIMRDSEQDGVYLYSDGSVFVEDTEIVNNEISNAYGESASGIEFWGSRASSSDFDPAVTGTIVRNNDITNCTYGVRIRDVSDITGTSVNYNNIVGNRNGIYNGVTSTIDATNNWWGATNGPSGVGLGDGDAVSENVLFHPYLENPYEESAAAVSFIATTEEPVIGIEVSPTFINFGAISEGITATGDTLTVTNTGNMPMSVSADLTEDTFYSGENYFYTRALKLNGKDSDRVDDPTNLGSWLATDLGLESIAVGGSKLGYPFPSHSVSTKLVVPEGITLGDTYTGTVVFWAELAH